MKWKCRKWNNRLWIVRLNGRKTTTVRTRHLRSGRHRAALFDAYLYWYVSCCIGSEKGRLEWVSTPQDFLLSLPLAHCAALLVPVTHPHSIWSCVPSFSLIKGPFPSNTIIHTNTYFYSWVCLPLTVVATVQMSTLWLVSHEAVFTPANKRHIHIYQAPRSSGLQAAVQGCVIVSIHAFCHLE